MTSISADLIKRYGVSGPRYTSYPSANHFHEEVSQQDYFDAIAEGNEARRALSLYFHIPFCRSVCYYCACNRIVTADQSRATAYVQQLKQEISLRAAHIDKQRPVVQMHWGGGTPTYLSDGEITELVHHIARHFHLLDADDGDYAIEVDPRTVTDKRISLLRALGFNRISLGVQDLDPQVQAAINRIQPYEQVSEVFNCARDLGFSSINTDLIYGLPRQSESSLARTLEQLLALRPERISLYNYAHLPARFKVQRQIDELTLPRPDEKLRMLTRAIDMLEGAGYLLIGMDHFALPEDELAQAQQQKRLHRNFQGYTLHGDADVIASGVSSISQIGNLYAQNWKSQDRWQADIDNGTLPLERGYILDRDEQLRRDFIITLLCQMSVDLSEFSAKWSIDTRSYFAAEWMQLLRLQQDGLVDADSQHLLITASGRPLARAVAMLFDQHLPAGQRNRYSRII